MDDEKKLTALVIEDNEDNMVLITKLLHMNGFKIIWADTGMKGLRMAQEENPDFILLDIQLPDIEGTEVLKKIRALDTSAGRVCVIAMTSYAMAGDRERLMALGCNGYIEKPINPMTVISQIRKVIEEYS
ncbi:MAG: response regulator [Candidatus Sabulitectum sp.]|nr:response regulator [Candidatus Sabulitectum sp.]